MQIRFKNGRAFVDGQACRFVPTEHVGGRIQPTLIVLHDTASRLNTDGVLSWLKKNPPKVSSTFVVGIDGELIQMALVDRKTSHAGESSWRGRRYCNGFAVPIEIVSPGKLVGRNSTEAVSWFGQVFPLGNLIFKDSKPHGGPSWWLPYDRRQIETVEALIRGLALEFPSITDVAGHWEISPGRKVDPGPHFPLDRMKAILSTREAPPVADLKKVQQRLADLGYHVGAIDGHSGPRTEAAVFAFQRQNHLASTGELDRQTVDHLMSVAALEFPNGAREAAAEAGDIPQSETLAGATVAKRGSETAGTFEIVNSFSQPISEGKSLIDKWSEARSFGDSLSALLDWSMSKPGIRTLIVLGLCLVVWRGAHKAAWARIRDFATGRNVGR